MIKNKYKKDIIRWHGKTLDDAINVIETRKRFWFEVKNKEGDEDVNSNK